MRLARVAIASIGLAALTLGSTASASARSSNFVAAPAENAAGGIAIDRQASALDSSEDLRGNPVLTVLIISLVLGILIALTSGSSSSGSGPVSP